MINFKQFYEGRVATNVRLTNHQKRALAIMIKSGGAVHDEEISFDRNMAAARQLLAKLGLIQNTEGDKYEITDQGKSVADDEGITDGGELTASGQQLATSDPSVPPPSAKPDSGPSDDPLSIGGEMAPPGLPESRKFKYFLTN